MDFSWSETQRELYDQAVAFARARLRRAHQPTGTEQTFERQRWGQCGEFGLLGLCVPERYGGMGLDALTTARVFEAFGRGTDDAGLLFAAAAHLFACVMPIHDYGDAALKDAMLSRLCSGELIGANAITEAEVGSDVFALKTSARLEGEDYVLSGVKSFVTNGPVADVFIVYASTNPRHGYMGLTAFAVERDRAGLTVGQPFDKIGLHGAPMSSVYLEDCRVPVRNRLGAEGQGAIVFQDSMRWERSCLFALYVGLMERQLDNVVEYAKERRQGGRPIGKYQGVSHRIADMKLRLESARLLLYRTCWLLDRNEAADMDIALSKIAVTEAAVQSGLDAIQLHGGLGITEESGVGAALRDAIPARIFSGTSEIQRNLVARGLGL